MNITVLGGGSAGWMTALLSKSYYPNSNITVIESDEIGILGAGEGTTTSFVQFLNEVDISVSEVIKYCNATIKQGIRFTNWHGDGGSFFHPFNAGNSLNHFKNFVATLNLSEGKSITDLDFANKLSLENKVIFTFNNNDNCLLEDPIKSFEKLGEYALHFDARLLANFLKDTACRRGIKRIEGKFLYASQDNNNNITSLHLENDLTINCDFVFDCSGFARLLIGKLYNTPWISYSKHLPMKSAIPFFINHNNDVRPETDAIAMKYGWCWKIPVKDRFGCGYVFDSDYITADQALEEAEEYFGVTLTSPKTFKFDPGCFEKTLVNNCMAVGLAQSFIEPLEATSIWISFNNLRNFLRQDAISFPSVSFEHKFNKLCLSTNNEVLEFIYLHYITKRADSIFWKEFKEKNQIPESLFDLIEILKNNHSVPLMDRYMFNIFSWLQVSGELGLLDSTLSAKILEKFDLDLIKQSRDSLLKNQNNLSKICVSHKDFLEYIRLK